MTTVEKVSPEIDYTHKVGNHSSPLYLKLNPINNVQSFTSSLTSVYGPIEILVPAKVLSLKKSKLSWDVQIPAQTTANSTYVFGQANALCQIDRIVITSQNTNNILLDLPNLNRYASMLSPAATTFTELQNKASPGYGTTIAGTVGAAPANYAASLIPPQFSTTAAIGQQIPLEDVSRNFGIANVDGWNNDTNTPFNGIRKLYSGSCNGAANYWSFEFDLGSLQATICDLDQLLYFSGEQLLISIYFAAANRWCFVSNSQSNPAGLATNAANNALGAANAAPIYNNINMYLYTEQNLSVSTGIVEKVMRGGGLSIPFPYPFIQRQAVSSGAFSITQQLTRGFGSKLLCALTSIFNSNEVNNCAQDHSLYSLITTNLGGGQYTLLTYNTLLDNIPILTNNNIQAFNSAAGQQSAEHWTYNKSHLKESAIVSLPQYNVEFVHIDNFCTDPLSSIDWSCTDGLDLDAMHQFSFVAYATASQTVSNNVYIAFICQKTLNLLPTGVQVS